MAPDVRQFIAERVVQQVKKLHGRRRRAFSFQSDVYEDVLIDAVSDAANAGVIEQHFKTARIFELFEDVEFYKLVMSLIRR